MDWSWLGEKYDNIQETLLIQKVKNNKKIKTNICQTILIFID